MRVVDGDSFVCAGDEGVGEELGPPELFVFWSFASKTLNTVSTLLQLQSEIYGPKHRKWCEANPPRQTLSEISGIRRLAGISTISCLGADTIRFPRSAVWRRDVESKVSFEYTLSWSLENYFESLSR